MHDLLDRGDEDLAIADLARPRGLDDRLDGAIDETVGDDELDLHLRQKVDHVFGSPVELGVPLLASEALDLGHRESRDTDLGQRFADLVQLERLDDRFDFFHGGGRIEKGLAERSLAYTMPVHGAMSSHSDHADVIG